MGCWVSEWDFRGAKREIETDGIQHNAVTAMIDRLKEARDANLASGIAGRADEMWFVNPWVYWMYWLFV